MSHTPHNPIGQQTPVTLKLALMVGGLVVSVLYWGHGLENRMVEESHAAEVRAMQAQKEQEAFRTEVHDWVEKLRLANPEGIVIPSIH